jgi:tetratricopeptide (TPR) repeat protein
VTPVNPKQKANAAASLLTTAGDYSRFLLAVLRGEGLRPETAAAMLTPQVHVPTNAGDPLSPPRDDIGWGLGWGLLKVGDRQSFWHWGHQDAWRAFVMVRRDGSAGLVFFADSATGLAIARPLAELAGVDASPALDWLFYESYDNPRWQARRDLLRAFLDGRTDAGLRRFREARAATPAVADAKLADEVAELLTGRGRNAEAIALETWNAESVGTADAHAGLAKTLLAAGEPARALRSYETAARLDPKKPRDLVIRWVREDLELRKKPVELPETALRGLTGDYGPRHVKLEHGGLTYWSDRRPLTYRLLATGPDTFLLDHNASVRIRFVTDGKGRATKLVALGSEGQQDEFPRD